MLFKIDGDYPWLIEFRAGRLTEEQAWQKVLEESSHISNSQAVAIFANVDLPEFDEHVDRLSPNKSAPP